MARIFLYIVAGVVTLVVVTAILFKIFERQLAELAFVPKSSFEETMPPPAPDYGEDAAWAVVPDRLGAAGELPEGIERLAEPLPVDILFIHPTTHLAPTAWNAALDDAQAQGILDRVLAAQASVFADLGHLYAPRYRQAAFGAFLDTTGQGRLAIAFAGEDVLRAFDHYISQINQDRPFVLAAHSQGSLHAIRILGERIAGTPAAERMVAAYIVGWPVSVENDLGAMPDIDACRSAEDTGCVVSWQSFGPEGDPKDVVAAFGTYVGINGQLNAGTKMLCTNPLSWAADTESADRAAHLGAIVSKSATSGFTGARCGEEGVLYMSNEPGSDFQTFKLPGENYHAYDYSLFYLNLRENVQTRMNAFLQAGQ